MRALEISSVAWAPRPAAVRPGCKRKSPSTQIPSANKAGPLSLRICESRPQFGRRHELLAALLLRHAVAVARKTLPKEDIAADFQVVRRQGRARVVCQSGRSGEQLAKDPGGHEPTLPSDPKPVARKSLSIRRLPSTDMRSATRAAPAGFSSAASRRRSWLPMVAPTSRTAPSGPFPETASPRSISRPPLAIMRSANSPAPKSFLTTPAPNTTWPPTRQATSRMAPSGLLAVASKPSSRMRSPSTESRSARIAGPLVLATVSRRADNWPPMRAPTSLTVPGLPYPRAAQPPSKSMSPSIVP